MLTFLSALYNEDKELDDLIQSVAGYVNAYALADDGSTDNTAEILQRLSDRYSEFKFKTIEHTGLPETVKNEALSLVEDGSWVLMLDADERVNDYTLRFIDLWLKQDPESNQYDYVFFRQIEIIDNKPVREYQKCKLFKKEAITFPLNNIHADDSFTGEGTYKHEWIVEHRKSSTKQIVRESEYVNTYKKLLANGHIDQGRFEWLMGLHHYVK